MVYVIKEPTEVPYLYIYTRKRWSVSILEA